MATFYIQLKDRLLQISGELTAENISKALGYVPVDSSTLNNYATKEEVSSLVDMSMVEELSQRVDNISFDNLKDNPFLLDGSGELNIVDEQGNVIAKVDSNGLHSVDFIAGEHKLTDKIDATALDGLAKETWVSEYVTKTVTDGKVDLTGYATEEYVDNKDFYDIKNNPIINGEEGNLIFVDESGNIGLKLDQDNNLTVKDVIAGDNILSNKVDKESGKGLSTEDFTTALKTKLQSLSNYDDTTITNAINTLREDFDTLVSGDTTTAIKTFNEIIAFLNGVEDTESLEGIISSIEQQIANIEIPSLDGYATESWVNDKNYLQYQDISHLATKEELDTKDFYEIHNNPIVNDGNGKLVFVDESGNIGLQFSNNAILVNDVITPEHILSSKVDKSFVEDNYYNKLTVDKKITEAVTGGQVSLDGFATEQWVNEQGFLKTHQDISGKQDKLISGTNIKTINGNSILGSGNIIISGSSSTESSVYSEINHGTEDTTFTIIPNTFHVWDTVSSLTLTLGEETSGVANEYLFQFTSGTEPTTLSLPSDIKFNEELVIEANKIYQISILKGLGTIMSWITKKIIVFSIEGNTSITYQAEEGMTWGEWVNSKYNVNGYLIFDGYDEIYSPGSDNVLYSSRINNVTRSDIISTQIYTICYIPF